MQKYLKDDGYQTGIYGKYLNAWNVSDNPPHFEEWVLEDPVVYNDGTYNVNGTVQTIAGYSTRLWTSPSDVPRTTNFRRSIKRKTSSL